MRAAGPVLLCRDRGFDSAGIARFSGSGLDPELCDQVRAFDRKVPDQVRSTGALSVTFATFTPPQASASSATVAP